MLASDSDFSCLTIAWGNESQTGHPNSSNLTLSGWEAVRLLSNTESTLTVRAHFCDVYSPLLEEFLF